MASVVHELSVELRLDYLITRFTNNNYKIKKNENDNHYPTALNKLIIKFVGNIFILFDTVHPEFAHIIKNNGKSFETKKEMKHLIVGCSNGFNTGIHSWTIKAMQGKGMNAIGITSSIDICKTKDVWIRHGSLKHEIFFLFGGGAIVSGLSSKTNIERWSLKNWKAGDLIKIVLDCDKWIIKYFINDEFIAENKITPNYTYYPVVGMQTYDNAFEFVDC